MTVCLYSGGVPRPFYTRGDKVARSTKQMVKTCNQALTGRSRDPLLRIDYSTLRSVPKLLGRSTGDLVVSTGKGRLFGHCLH